MTSSFRKTVDKLNAQNGDRLPCSFCQTPTLRATLGNYGARCFECYEAYCREPQGAAKPQQPKGGNVQRALDVAFDPKRIAAAKASTTARIAEYAREHGLELDAPSHSPSRAQGMQR